MTRYCEACGQLKHKDNETCPLQWTSIVQHMSHYTTHEWQLFRQMLQRYVVEHPNESGQAEELLNLFDNDPSGS
jgi:hypothetical protein